MFSKSTMLISWDKLILSTVGDYVSDQFNSSKKASMIPCCLGERSEVDEFVENRIEMAPVEAPSCETG